MSQTENATPHGLLIRAVILEFLRRKPGVTAAEIGFHFYSLRAFSRPAQSEAELLARAPQWALNHLLDLINEGQAYYMRDEKPRTYGAKPTRRKPPQEVVALVEKALAETYPPANQTAPKPGRPRMRTASRTATTPTATRSTTTATTATTAKAAEETEMPRKTATQITPEMTKTIREIAEQPWAVAARDAMNQEEIEFAIANLATRKLSTSVSEAVVRQVLSPEPPPPPEPLSGDARMDALTERLGHLTTQLEMLLTNQEKQFDKLITLHLNVLSMGTTEAELPDEGVSTASGSQPTPPAAAKPSNPAPVATSPLASLEIPAPAHTPIVTSPRPTIPANMPLIVPASVRNAAPQSTQEASVTGDLATLNAR